MNTKLFYKLIKEPVFHFLLIGALIFVVSDLIDDEDSNSNYVIEITRGDLESLFNRWLLQFNRMPSEQELYGFIENMVREEILFREAKAIGLGKEDVIIKRRLVQKIEFLTDDLIDPPEPTDEEARKHFESNIDVYTVSERVDFLHIYFNPDVRSQEEMEVLAEDIKNNLNRKKNVPERYFELGDLFMLAHDFSDLSRTKAVNSFGDQEFADKLFEAEIGKWQGPFMSSYGFHLVYVYKKSEPEVPEFETLKDQVKMHIVDRQREEANENFFEELKSSYKIIYSEDFKSYADSLNLPLRELD